jgi:dihydropteroate synthase
MADNRAGWRSGRGQCSASRPRVTLRLAGRDVVLGARTLVMGVVNCTPDSFYAGGRCPDPAGAVGCYHQLLAEGADWIDVGGESTRPGAPAVDAAEEWRRVEPVLEAARRAGHPVPLSIDTTKAAVAARALDAGAAILNDVSALRFDAQLATLAARYGAGLVLMHMRGTPRTMQADPCYGDVAAEIIAELAEAIGEAVRRGVAREQIIVDPGIGFGKTAVHNLEILRRLAEFSALGRPVLVGCSRKSFIGEVLDLPAEERLAGTLAAHAAAVLAGAHAVRVHDVAAHVRAVRVLDALLATESA